jgi:catechol 2,3-dioxygenase-like lactoylglutathione lyase family enzyme
MPTEVTGIDHIYIAVQDMPRSEAFYDVVMILLGFRKSAFALGGAPHVQYFNRHFGYVLRPAIADAPSHSAYHPGLHHFCFRVEDQAAVENVAREFKAAGIACSEPRRFPEYAPDYHAVFFEDPDGIRLEVTNYRQERRDRFEQWDAQEGKQNVV